MIKNISLKNLKYQERYYKLITALILSWLISFNIYAQYVTPTELSTPYFYNKEEEGFFECGATLEVNSLSKKFAISDIIFLDAGVNNIGSIQIHVDPIYTQYIESICIVGEDLLNIEIFEKPGVVHAEEFIVPVCISFYYRKDNTTQDQIIKILPNGDKSLETASPLYPAGTLIECCFYIKFPPNMRNNLMTGLYVKDIGIIECGGTISVPADNSRFSITDIISLSTYSDLLTVGKLDLKIMSDKFEGWIVRSQGPRPDGENFGARYISTDRFDIEIQEVPGYYHDEEVTVYCCVKYLYKETHKTTFGENSNAFGMEVIYSDYPGWNQFQNSAIPVECCFYIKFPPHPRPVPAEVRPCVEYQSKTIIDHQLINVDPCEQSFTVRGDGFDMSGATFEWYAPNPEGKLCGDPLDYKLPAPETSPTKSLGTGTYYVKINMSQGCSYCIPIEVSCTGTHQPEDPFFSTFPNPVDNGSVLTVNFNLDRPISTSVSFINETTYEQIYQYHCGELQAGEYSLPIQLPMMPAGNYFLFLNRDGEAPVYKHIFIQ